MGRGGLGIRFQLTAGIVVMTIAGIGLIGLLSVKIVERSSVLWKASEAEGVARLVGSYFRLQGGSDLALSSVGEALREAGIADFRLLAPGGEIAASGGSIPAGAGQIFFSSDGVQARRYGGGWLAGADDMLLVAAPVQWQGRGEGTLEFMVSLRDLNEDMAAAKRFLLLYALLDSVIIIAFGAYLLSRAVVRPIKGLEEAATRIAGGKLYERASVKVDNEIGSLAHSFNRMAQRLEEEIRSLESVNVELLSAHDELLRSSTLAAVGSLAAGIAHEIGNPLGALRGYIDLLGRGGLDPDEERDIVERASREAARIDSIVREFLEVSRPSRPAMSPVDVNSVLSEALSAVAAREDFVGVSTPLALGQRLPGVMADEGKLRQVFLNLLINAAHAMEGCQVREIAVATFAETRRARAGRRKGDAPMHEAPGREFVCVSFSDSGSGITDEDARKVFDPFFTTKDVGSGTGLGLFVSRSIIKAYGGEITFRSAPGEGSVFTVALPAGRTP